MQSGINNKPTYSGTVGCDRRFGGIQVCVCVLVRVPLEDVNLAVGGVGGVMATVLQQ